MNLVIDANILIAALLRDSKVRELIVNSPYKLLVPEVHFQEIEEHKKELLEKSGLSEVLPFIEEAGNLIGSIDKDDVPIIATSLAHDSCLIWSDDRHFQQQKKIKVWRKEEVIRATKN